MTAFAAARRPWWMGTVLIAGWLFLRSAPGQIVPPGLRPVAPPQESAEDEGTGLFLPTDRVKERQLDRARRLLEEGRHSDAATLLDELIAADRDAFVQGDDATSSRLSIKAEAAAIVAGLPRPAREAYDLLFRSRAERMLGEAIATDDDEAIVAVARRWFETPAGHRAAILAAVSALESGQPLAASAWLDRLAASDAAAAFEPTLTVMRAVARQRSGDTVAAATLLATVAGRGAVSIGGAPLDLSGEPGQALARLSAHGGTPAAAPAAEWRQVRGDPARNALVAATRPLLVPRYRVPLTRHPEESRLLERRRKVSADKNQPLMPAGIPLAVGSLIVVHTPLGVLGIDFETGKRVWLASAGLAGRGVGDAGDGDDGGQSILGRAFDDATSGGLASDGRLVFAIESPREALTATVAPQGFQIINGMRTASWQGGNTLSAYDTTAGGAVRWRLPADAGGRGGNGSSTWYMGAPLVVGAELFVLAESRGEIRLDVLDAETGGLRWSQPLAELDDRQAIAGADALGRRIAGLTPALGGGVLVCPLGAGSVVAVDLATRTLRWAHTYERVATEVDPRQQMMQRQVPQQQSETADVDGWRDACPVIVGSRVLLTPPDATELLCLDLADGRMLWQQPPRGRLQIAGVVDDRVILLGPGGVEAVSLQDGSRSWQTPYGAAGVAPSGRGILTATRLFLPLDTPEVVEFSLADGAVVGRSAARGGSVPGNLVAYRGEVISRGVDTLEVFHQSAALETRIETARAAAADDPWAVAWQGQLDLDRGDIAAGLEKLAAAATAPRTPPGMLADAVIFAMQRDFAAAAPLWREALGGADVTRRSTAAREALRVAVDGFLREGALDDAWDACEELLRDARPAAAGLVRDLLDPAVATAPDRWLRGRLLELARRAPPPLAARIDAAVREVGGAAAATTDRTERIARLESVVARVGGHPAAADARRALEEAYDRLLADTVEASGRIATQRDFLQFAAARHDDAARAAVAANREAFAAARHATPPDAAAAWPLGRVVQRKTRGERDVAIEASRSRVVPLPVDGDPLAWVPGMGLSFDVQQGQLFVADGCGRRVTEPLSIDPGSGRMGMPWLPQAVGFQASAIGRVLFVRCGGVVSAYDLGAAGSSERRLWSHAEATQSPRELSMAAWGRAVGGRVARNGSVPLGMRITEPDDPAQPSAPRGGRARISGVISHGDRSLALLDPATGAVLWERTRLAAGSEIVGDDDALTICTPDGAGSLVLSMDDGRVLHAFDLPNRRQRLASSGRRIVTVQPLDAEPGQATARTVRLELADPVTRTAVPLGDLPGESRAVTVGDDRLATLAPDGSLAVYDLATGTADFRIRLPEMPTRFEHLHVLAWQDRYLVFAGGPPTDAAERLGEVTSLQQLLIAGDASPPLSGCVWAVERSAGDLLWPVPATIERHCLHTSQPGELPVLLFCRQVQPVHDREHQNLSVLCLDKRTGHAVLEEDRIPGQSHMLFGCDIEGDPTAHTVTVRELGAAARQITLEFTGGPMPPRPPFQATERPPSPQATADGLPPPGRRPPRPGR